MSTTIVNSDITLATALDNYRAALGKKIKAAASKKNAATEASSSAYDQLQNKTCSYLKLQATKDLYFRVDQCISIAAHKESELIKANVGAIVKETEALKKQIGAISKTLKSVKTEVYSIKELSCNLVDCCFKKDKDQFPESYKKICTITDLESKLASIKTKGEGAYEMADLTFMAAVSVSGIQGFANVDSLKSYSEELVTAMSALKNDVAQNCKDLSKSIETTIEERTVLVATLAEAKYAGKDANCEETAMCNTWNKSCGACDEAKDHPRKGKIALEAICEKFKCDLGDGNSPGGPIKQKPQGGGVQY